MSDRPHIAAMLPEDIAHHLGAHGLDIRPSEARRVLAHAISPMAPKGRKRHPLSRQIQDAAAEAFDDQALEVVEQTTDARDGFVKYLFRHPDGALTEAVRIPLHKPGRFSVCLSSQVGCAMGCAFCATGRLGFHRNLEAWEMVRAFLAVRDEAPGRVSGAVFMGQGEPLNNYDAVMRAARVLSHPCGGAISAQAISVSTVGVVPQILRFARERRPYRLIVSLTSAIDDKRAALLPAASRYSVAEIGTALREYARACKTRVTIAWVLLSGVNTGEDEVAALQECFGDLPLRLNLVDVNDPRPHGFRPADDAERGAFMDGLARLGVPIVRRYSGGASEHAACGMLAATRPLRVFTGP